MRKFFIHLGVIGLALLALAAAAELSIRMLVEGGTLSAPRPAPSNSYWDSDHESFGVWHRPGETGVHTTECFSVEYRANSVGARDTERPRESAAPRVVVLGDSFAEGWGIETRDRLSNVLESRTGIPHLNFAMAHFSPYQAYLAYRDLALEFRHDAVLIAVVPTSDFADLDIRRAMKRPGYEYRYRPYLIGEYPDFEEVVVREGRIQRWLRRHSFAHNAVSYLASQVRQPSPREQRSEAPETGGEKSHHHSFFHDYSPRLFSLLQRSLELLVEASEGRSVAVLLVPSMRDLARYDQTHDSPLGNELRRALARQGVHVVDLLPAMYERRDDLTAYFIPCDIHWSAEANAVAAEILLENLAGVIYPE